MKKPLLFILISILFLTSCKAKEIKSKEAKVNTFKSVSMEEGLKFMASDKDFILLDVRTPEEFAGGHIPGALQLTTKLLQNRMPKNFLKTNLKPFMFTAVQEEDQKKAARS